MKPTLICCFSKNQGGMELMSITLSKLLSTEGDVFLACRKNSFIHLNAEKYGFKGKIIPFSFQFNFSIKFILDFSKILKNLKIQNIIFLGASELKSLYFACRNKNINFLNFHGTTKTHVKKDIFHRLFYSVVKTHVCVSDHIQRNVRKILPFYEHTKAVTIYTPQNMKYEAVQKPQDHWEGLLVARIAGGKGHLDAIQACERYTKKKILLRFVGNIEDKRVHQELLDYLETSPFKSNVFFEGPTPHVATYYNKAHFLIFPSTGEGLPGVLIEALQSKVLPITYDNTVFPEFLKNGFQFPQASDQNVEDLSQKLAEMLDHFDDWNEAMESNYKIAQDIFSYQSIQKKYLELLV